MKLTNQHLTTSALGAFLLLLLVDLPQCRSDEIVRRRTGNTCGTDGDCPDNAFCKTSGLKGYCECKDNHFIQPFNNTHRECLREATNLGDSCKIDIQCMSKLSVHSHCTEGVCQCKKGAHLDEGRCYETALIGQRCVVTQNCYLGADDSRSNQAYCVRGLCQCTMLHSPRDGGTRCLKDAMLGDPCEDNEHCSGDNTRCNNVCRCADGHVLHPDEERCLKAATTLNEMCEIEAQCTYSLNGTTCTGMQCQCQYDFHQQDGQCWMSKSMGQRCIANQECITDNNERGKCINNKCACPGCSPGADGLSGSQTRIVPFLTAIQIAIVSGVIGIVSFSS